MWKHRTHIIATLTDLVGTEKKKFTWSSEHQKTFDDMKAVMAKETIQNYPKFDQCFDIHTDASNRQLGAVISQNGNPLITAKHSGDTKRIQKHLARIQD